MYNSNANQPPASNPPNQHMQFPPPPPMAPLVSKNDANNISAFNPLIVPKAQQSQQPMNLNHPMMPMMPNGYGAANNHNQSTILMSSMLANKSTQSLQYQQQIPPPQQQQQQQYPRTYLTPQQHSQTSQQPLQSQVQQMPQMQPCTPISQTTSCQQQQVPMTTIMIPSSAAVQLQNASMQIQQAVMSASATNPVQPQILVFMIPYPVQPQPPTIPPTPEQTSSNSTLVRQSHLQVSARQPNNQQQVPQQHQQQQQQQHQQPPQATPSTHTRAVSSLSNPRQEPEKFYVKANFSFQASRNKTELSFQKGDILHVIDTLQHNDYGARYWLATRVKSNGKDAEKGLVPNKNRAEEIALEQRTLDIGEHSGTLDTTSSGVLSASVGRVNFLKRRAAQRSKSLCKDHWDNVVFDFGSIKLPTYERVVYKHPGFCRPVVIFGPLSDVAREKLLKDYPEKYSYPTGFSQSPDHPRVIRLKGVLDVIDQGKHALLDITPSAVEKLNYANLVPIVIFMKTDSKSIIKEFRSRAAKSLDPNARDEDTLRRDGKSSRKLLEQSVKLEKAWFHVFTATLDLSTMGSEMWYRKLRETIENQQSANVWMSERKTEKRATLASGGTDVMLPIVNAQSSVSCVDDTSLLNERFNESVNITSKSTIDLVPDGTYGNRGQLRSDYAHSLAQKLARASSEPKLNGLLSDHPDDELDDNEDDDDDDEPIKKPFPIEFENSSSISSSNGATSYGHSSMSAANVTYQHYPPPMIKSDQGSSRMQENIYSRNSMIQNANSSSNISNNNGNNFSNGSASNYHPIPQMASDNEYHINQSMTSINANNAIDLSRNHDTRGSAFQVYSDINQNNYHYYNMNKI